MPRNSFVQTALEGARTLTCVLRATLTTWWRGDLSIRRRSRDPTCEARQRAAMRTPQPLGAFPELHRLCIHEPWLVNPAVRVQCMWDSVGSGGERYGYFVLSDGRLATLGILMRQHELAYMRLHANRAFAAVDGALWAGEIRDRPVRRALVLGGVDRPRRRTWSVSIVQRQGRFELQITTGGLIPWTRDYRSLEDAMLAAEEWVTDLHHQEPDNGRPGRCSSQPPGSQERRQHGWLM